MGCIFCLLLASLFIFTEMSNIIVSPILLLHHASELNHIHVCFQQESGFTSHLFGKQQAMIHGERKGANHGRKISSHTSGNGERKVRLLLCNSLTYKICLCELFQLPVLNMIDRWVIDIYCQTISLAIQHRNFQPINFRKCLSGLGCLLSWYIRMNHRSGTEQCLWYDIDPEK